LVVDRLKCQVCLAVDSKIKGRKDYERNNKQRNNKQQAECLVAARLECHLLDNFNKWWAEYLVGFNYAWRKTKQN
jgi:hypothetical protein